LFARSRRSVVNTALTTSPAAAVATWISSASAKLKRSPAERAVCTRGALAFCIGTSGGVSNFSVDELEKLFAVATVYPVVDQVKFSVFEYRRRLLDSAEARNVALEAYSPLGTGRYLSDETVRRVAQRNGRTPAQVLLRWCVQHGLPVLAKSTHRERLAENAQIFDFTLSQADMSDLDALDTTGGTSRAVEAAWWS